MSNEITARKNGQWMVICMAPDVCKTPVGSAIVPIPYPVIAKLGDSVKTIPNVKANGDELLTISGHIPTTLGDQAGVQKGIKSGTVGAAASYKKSQHSSTVRAGKQRILRHGDMYWMNGKAPSGIVGKPTESSKPTPHEIQLAKTEGVTPAQIDARKKVAKDFYSQQGMPEHKIAGHTAGIDHSKPVDVITLPKGKSVGQYQVPNAPQGSYYSEKGIRPTKLGIADTAKDHSTGKIVKKESNSYEVNGDVKVLRSSASSIEDTWSMPGETIKTDGGATQYFTMEKSKFTKK